MKTLLELGLCVMAALMCSIALARPFTASDLVTLRQIGTVAVSPSGRWLVWDQHEADLAASRVRSRLWLLDLEHPHAPRQLSPEGRHPGFSSDGDWIYFLSGDQLWRVPARDGAAQQVGDVGVPITGFSLSPAADRIAIWADVSTACNELPCTLPQPADSCCGNGRAFDDAYIQRRDTWRRRQARSTIYVAHRDEWMMPEIRPRVYVMSLDGGKASSAMGQSSGDAQRVSWGADGKTLFFALREAGREERFSLNIDVIASSVEGSTNLTSANPGVDTLPAASPDGRWLAYVSAPRSDLRKQTLQLRHVATGKVTSIAEDWDASVRSIAWTADSRSLLVTARAGMDEPLFQITLDGGRRTRLTAAGRVSNVVPLPHAGAVLTLDSMLQPPDLYRVSGDGQVTRLSAINADRLQDIDLPRLEWIDFKGAQGAAASAWKMSYAAKRGPLPTLLVIPNELEGEAANGWSRHWNALLFSAPGYAVVGIQSQGSNSAALDDLQLGLSAVGVDVDQVCVAGDGAYGGLLVYRIAGAWSRQPRCLIANGGVVDAASMALQADEPWMHDWQESSVNPLQFVGAWRAPLLILHGERNFRVPYVQSVMAFTAAQRGNVPSRLVIFPDEGVRTEAPKNAIQWYGEVLNWIDRWLSHAGTRQSGEHVNLAP